MLATDRDICLLSADGWCRCMALRSGEEMSRCEDEGGWYRMCLFLAGGSHPSITSPCHVYLMCLLAHLLFCLSISWGCIAHNTGEEFRYLALPPMDLRLSPSENTLPTTTKPKDIKLLNLTTAIYRPSGRFCSSPWLSPPGLPGLPTSPNQCWVLWMQWVVVGNDTGGGQADG